MITVSKNQLDQIQYLIRQSIQGNHVLFDIEAVKAALSGDTAASSRDTLTDDEAYATEPLLERLIALPSLVEKRAYLEGLDSGTYRKVVQTYFHIVENTLLGDLEVKH